ncbi:MAG: purine-nucleoside phosphorylase [Candidatus Delongbacteria bacterium]|nr:purine-nucleoside phosphorylase [Candidatus Delongbacteria bacterium]MBN2836295.1 purine-nucleoside phosphorylase [Candidatus Delongbacteria bacterium]
MKINEFTDSVISRFGQVDIAVVLGSGLGFLAESLEDAFYFSYREIDGHPISTVVGHDGKYCIGRLNGVVVCLLSGRFHYYEGYDLDKIIFYQSVLKELGVKNIILTNAAGGVNRKFKPGDLMIIKDFMNLTKSDVDNKVSNLSKNRLSVPSVDSSELWQGVYAFMEGPNFETPSEIKMLEFLGVDAVGMSTVPEIKNGLFEGFLVSAVSCITNMAAGILDNRLTHQEVFEAAEKAKTSFGDLIRRIVNSV